MSKIAEEITKALFNLGPVVWTKQYEKTIDDLLEGRTIRRSNFNKLLEGFVRETVRRVAIEGDRDRLRDRFIKSIFDYTVQIGKLEELKSKLWDAEQEVHDLKYQLGRQQDWNETLTEKQINELNQHEEAEYNLYIELDRVRTQAARDGVRLESMINHQQAEIGQLQDKIVASANLRMDNQVLRMTIAILNYANEIKPDPEPEQIEVPSAIARTPHDVLAWHGFVVNKS